MGRKTIIFGNGLGRALDNNYFQLPAAMKSVWSNQDAIDQNQRKLIASAIEGVEIEFGPTDEEQLLGTQLALIACRLLKHAVQDNLLEHWLTSDAMEYPAALQRYNFMVAKYFHEYEIESCSNPKWEPFIDKLVSFIDNSKSHVATLNYDTLLYEPFNTERTIGGKKIQLCDGFRGILRDGYTNSDGFCESNLERKSWNIEQSSFYMHLHGSPLFVDGANCEPKKLKRRDLLDEDGTTRSHIVLTHGRFKPTVIQSSKVLQMYWDHLPIAIKESEEIVVFGYSGADTHLNKLVRKYASDKPIKVVELANANADKQETVWKHRLGQDVTLVAMKDVLEFTDW